MAGPAKGLVSATQLLIAVEFFNPRQVRRKTDHYALFFVLFISYLLL